MFIVLLFLVALAVAAGVALWPRLRGFPLRYLFRPPLTVRLLDDIEPPDLTVYGTGCSCTGRVSS